MKNVLHFIESLLLMVFHFGHWMHRRTSCLKMKELKTVKDAQNYLKYIQHYTFKGKDFEDPQFNYIYSRLCDIYVTSKINNSEGFQYFSEQDKQCIDLCLNILKQHHV